jgi:transposase
VNTLRGHAAEFGVIAAKGLRQVGPLLTAIEQETAIPPEAKDMASLFRASDFALHQPIGMTRLNS